MMTVGDFFVNTIVIKCDATAVDVYQTETEVH